VARRTIFCHKVRQNTARIDRIIDNMVICRTFLRSVFTVIIARVGGSIARISRIATSAVLRVFLGFNVSAVGADGVFAT
jgi:hypothetical protein